MTDTLGAGWLQDAEQGRQRRAGRAGATVLGAQGVNPDAAAAGEKAARALGLAPVTVPAPELEAQAQAQANAIHLQSAPKTSDFLTDPNNANVAHDQVGPLAGLERLVDGIFGKGKFDANVDTARRFGGDLLTGIGSGFSGLATTARAVDRYSIPGQPQWSPLAAPLNEIGASFKAAGGDVSGARPLYFPRNSGVDTGLAGDVVGGLGQITGQVLVGAGTGGTATLPFLYGQGVDQMNDRVVADMAADGRTQRTAADDLAAQAGGLVTAATEKIGLDRILHAVPAAVKQKVLSRLTDIAVAGITEGTTEALEQVGQNALSINLLGTPGGLANYVDGAPDAAAPASLVGSIARLAVQAAIPGVQHVHTANAAATATADHAAFEQAVEAVTSNPLLERSPERFRQYLASATDNANVYVPAEAAREFFQSNPELDQWLDEWDIRDQYEQALVAGTDIAIPTATYLTQVAPTDAHAAFSQDLRLGPDAMSLREVQDFEAQGEETLGEAVDSAVQQGVQSQADEAPVERVRADIFDQLRSAGVSVEVARQNAVLVAARARTRAQRSPDLYPDAWAAYTADGGLKVQAEVPASVQRERDRLDVVIEVMRNRNGAPTQRALKGQTLLEFLSDNGGVTDTGGELAAMGAGAFNRPSQGGRRGARPVIRTEGGNAYGSDYAAQRAVEAGYLPEGADGNALFNAMREEIAGRPVYSATYARDAAAETTLEAAGDLEALLPTLGLDATATNDEIRTAVAKMGDAPAGSQSAQPTLSEMADRLSADNAALNAEADRLEAEAATYSESFSEESTVQRGVRIAGSVAGVLSETNGVSYAEQVLPALLDAGRLDAATVIVARARNEAARGAAATEDNPNPMMVASRDRNNAAMERVDAIVRNADERSFNQDDDALGPKRGNIRFTDAGAMITLFKAKDRSTFLHEISHKWLDELVIDATAGDGGLPAVADGMVRMYHGGEPTGSGKLWFARSYDYARNYHGGPNKVWYVDVPAAMLSPDGTVEDGFAPLHNLELPAEIADQRQAVDGARSQVQRDLQTVLDWFSKEAGKPITVDDIGVDQHELWARGGEVFFLEGKAPSAELRPAFKRFTEWLKGIYRSVVALNAPVSQPVREVMGRLIATDEEIATVQQAQALNRLFATPEDAGMTKDEFARYTAADNVAQAEASARLMKKTMEPLRRERTLEWKNEREALRPRQTEIVDALPDIAAIRTLTETGERINRQALIDLYGSDRVLKLLPRGKTALYSDDGTVHPDALADAVGATSGEALVNALMSNQAERQARKAQGDNRSVREARIEDRLDAEMEFLHGDPLNDGSLEEEALNAVHEKRRADMLATEASQLARLAGTPALWTREGIEAYAHDTVLNLRASKLRPGAYLRAERKAGIDAQRALLKGKHAEALDAKLLQSVNFALYRAVLDAQQAIEKGENLFAKVVTAKDKTTAKSRNFDMVNAARSILAGYGIARKGGEAVKSYMDALKAYDPDAYAALAEVVDEAMLNAKPMDDLTVGEFNDLHATIDQLWTLSRETQNSMIEGRKVENEVIRGELVADLAKDGPPKERPGKVQAVTKAERRNRALWSVRNFFGRVEEYALRRGPAFTKYVWRPVSQAGDAYRTLQRTHLPTLQAALETLAEDVHKVRRIEAPEIGYTFGASEITGVMEIVGALRHVGNPSNYRKLLLGRGWGSENADGSLNDASFRAMLDRLHREGVIQKRHWDYVQAEWDLHETVKPEVQRAHRRMTGAYFEEVTAAPVTTPFGVYAGGYVPAKVDPNIDSRAAEFDLQGILANGANGSFNFPSATNGFTKGRVDYNRPLNLDVRQAISQFSEVMRYATLGPAVQDVNRILRERQFADTLDSYDRDVWNEFLQPWLTRAVSQRVNTPSTSKFGSLAERTLNTVASRAGTAIMMGNVLNAAQQVIGLAPAALRTGKRNLANSMRLYVANPAAMTRQVAELSPMMANRMGTQMRDLTDAARDISIAPNLLEKAVNFTDRHKYFLQTGVQNMLDPMIWTAAYNRALSANDENPVAYADSVIRTTQDSYAAEGATNFAAGPAWANALKMFTGYFVGQANLLATEVSRTRDLPPAQKAVRLAEIYTLGVLVTAVGSEAILEALTGTLGDEDNDGWFDDLADLFVMSQIRYLLAFVPIGGAVANSVLNRFDDRPYNDKLSLSPVTSSVEALGSSAVDVQKAAQGKGDASRTVKDFGSLITTFTGLPTFQKQTGYVADVLEGDVEPTSAADAARGFVSGRASKESRTDQ